MPGNPCQLEWHLFAQTETDQASNLAIEVNRRQRKLTTEPSEAAIAPATSPRDAEATDLARLGRARRRQLSFVACRCHSGIPDLPPHEQLESAYARAQSDPTIFERLEGAAN